MDIEWSRLERKSRAHQGYVRPCGEGGSSWTDDGRPAGRAEHAGSRLAARFAKLLTSMPSSGIARFHPGRDQGILVIQHQMLRQHGTEHLSVNMD